jgi:hypothetical protein
MMNDLWSETGKGIHNAHSVFSIEAIQDQCLQVNKNLDPISSGKLLQASLTNRDQCSLASLVFSRVLLRQAVWMKYWPSQGFYEENTEACPEWDSSPQSHGGAEAI